MDIDDIYSLDELIANLHEIWKNGDGTLNYPKAFLSLALEIKQIKRKTDCITIEKNIDGSPKITFSCD